MVRGTVEETLNAMLDAEADQLCGAGRYERSEARQDTRAGSYERTLQTSAGEVSLKVPKLRRQTFETAIIERYRRRESSVEEALIEMYLAGISVRRVEDITEALWGTRVSPSAVSNLNKKIYAKIEAWRNRRIEGEHPYLYLDGIVMKRTWAGEVRNVSLLVASAVNSEGFREILGICEGAKEDKSGWSAFLRHLVDRGLKGVQLIISDACRGLMESAAEYLSVRAQFGHTACMGLFLSTEFKRSTTLFFLFGLSRFPIHGFDPLAGAFFRPDHRCRSPARATAVRTARAQRRRRLVLDGREHDRIL